MAKLMGVKLTGAKLSSAKLIVERLMIILLVLVIAGCASNNNSSLQEEARAESKENLLLNAGDKNKLIAFYKRQLKQEESPEQRMKLIEAYLESGDIESAAFHLSEVESGEDNAAHVVFLKAQVAYLTGEYIKAYQYVQTALSLNTYYPEAENLMGLIQAERGELDSAREYFLMARRHYYDDLVIKNNLAVVDLIEGDYQSAIDTLQPVYSRGEADKKIISNLVIAYTKLGEYKAVESVLKEQNYSDEQIQRIFLALRKAKSQDIENLRTESQKPDVQQPEPQQPEPQQPEVQLPEIQQPEGQQPEILQKPDEQLTTPELTPVTLRVKVSRGPDYDAD